MLDVFITVDTEIWCDGWQDLDEQFPGLFRKYVYGPTSKGDYALPGTLSILKEFGLQASFFVEPLFSARFGLDPLQEMVGLIQEGGQEVQLHLHPEWVDEAKIELLPGTLRKIPYLTLCDREQQSRLMRYGLRRLSEAGVEGINAFRAGSYSANADTLRAAAENQLVFDTSYNPTSPLGVADMAPGELLTQPRLLEGVYEFPVSAFRESSRGGLRHLQVTACSYQEMLYCLNTALDLNWDSLVIVTHNFELLSPDKSRVDSVVLNRFRRLCRFLDQNRDRFNVRGFRELKPRDLVPQPPPFASNPVRTTLRTAGQVLRRIRFG